MNRRTQAKKCVPNRRPAVLSDGSGPFQRDGCSRTASPAAVPRLDVEHTARPVHIEYFPRAADDCPLILLHGRDPEAAARLREQVAALAVERIQRVAVHEILGFESVAGCRLFASGGRSDSGTRQLRERQEFECLLRPVSWHNVEGLLAPFTERTFYDGFQWLDSHGNIRLLISGHRGW